MPSQLSIIFVAYLLLTFLADSTCTATHHVHVHASFSMSHPGIVAMVTSDWDKVWVFTFEPLTPHKGKLKLLKVLYIPGISCQSGIMHGLLIDCI